MRDKIISKSEELFLSLGFKSVTMDDIANAIGISKKTIYAHFSNKTALVEVVIFETLDHIYEGIDKINASSINPIEELYERVQIHTSVSRLFLKQTQPMTIL